MSSNSQNMPASSSDTIEHHEDSTGAPDMIQFQDNSDEVRAFQAETERLGRVVAAVAADKKQSELEDETSKPFSFKLFALFEKDIVARIAYFACLNEGRVVELEIQHYDVNKPLFSCRSSAPAPFHTNTDFRLAAKEVFKPLRCRGRFLGTYVNFKLDTIYFGGPASLKGFLNPDVFGIQKDIPSLTHVLNSITSLTMSINSLNAFVRAIDESDCLPALKEIILVPAIGKRQTQENRDLRLVEYEKNDIPEVPQLYFESLQYLSDKRVTISHRKLLRCAHSPRRADLESDEEMARRLQEEEDEQEYEQEDMQEDEQDEENQHDEMAPGASEHEKPENDEEMARRLQEEEYAQEEYQHEEAGQAASEHGGHENEEPETVESEHGEFTQAEPKQKESGQETFQQTDSVYKEADNDKYDEADFFREDSDEEMNDQEMSDDEPSNITKTFMMQGERDMNQETDTLVAAQLQKELEKRGNTETTDSMEE